MSRRIRDRARREASQSNKDKYFFNIGRERLNAESGKQRDVRLQQMRELTRDTRVSESSEQKGSQTTAGERADEELQVRKQMRDCLADESVEKRENKLQQMREQMRDRLADESVEQRCQVTANE